MESAPQVPGSVPAALSDRYAREVKAAHPAISDVTERTLVAWLRDRQEPVYRARQIRRHIARGTEASWDELTDLPKALRDLLARSFRFSAVEPETEIASADGETRKALLRLHDGHHIESVSCRITARGTRSASRRRRAVRWPARSAPRVRWGWCATSRSARSSIRC